MEPLQYNSVLIGLDLTTSDDHLLRFVKAWSSYVKMNDVYFVHVAEDLLPDDLPQHLNSRPADEELIEQMHESIGKYLPQANFDVHIEVHEGETFEKLLRLSRIKSCDLMIFGVKAEEESGSGLNPLRLLRNASCSTLLVPPRTDYSLNHLACAIDFSEHSKLVVKKVEALAGEGTLLNYIHFFKSSFHYLRAAESSREAQDHLKQKASERWLEFCRELVEKPRQLELLPMGTEGPEIRLQQLCAERDIDLLIIGSKGQTASVSTLIGSFAEKVATSVLPCPLLVARHKGENFDLVHLLIDFTSH